MKFEADLINFLQTNASVGWIKFFQAITSFGSLLGAFIVFVIIFIKNKKLGVAFALTFASASVVNYLIKHLIKRDRPFVTYTYIENYGGDDGFSMPSGHSMCSGLYSAFLIYYLYNNRKDFWTRFWGTCSLALFPFLIALSRMVLGVHFLSDTLVGIVIGILFAIIGIWLYNVLNKNRETKENK